MDRSKIPGRIATSLLVANNHTCCICRQPRKHVQIHHIDGDNSNCGEQNLAVLCLDCHSRVTGDEGLGRRYSETEVREYKRRWEEHCAETNTHGTGGDEEEDDEPVESDFDSLLIRAGGNYSIEISMTKDQELLASVSADDYIDASICSLADHRKWLGTNDLMEYVGREDVRECELSFVAPSDGTYCLLLINDSDEDVDATVEFSVWEP
jgi:hypothetical protein